MTHVVSVRGNTPLDTVPPDYLPAGAEARWYVLQAGPDAGKKLFFYDSVLGQGEPLATVVFVHGNPESSYTYRQAMDAMVSQFDGAVRVVAMDHIGFGLSDQASFEMVDFHHARNLRELVEYLDLRDATLVIHDWGGAIGVGAFIDMPERVNALVLMNTTVFPMPADGFDYRNFPFPGFMAWNRLGHWWPARWWRFIPPMVMFSPAGRFAFLRHSVSFAWRALTRQLSAKEQMYRDMFRTRSNALSSMRNVKQTGVWGHGYRYFDETLGWQDNSEFYRNIHNKISKVWGAGGRSIPARAVWGLWDPCAKDSVRQQWLLALPQLEGNYELFPERGHFVEEQEPEAVARAIVNVVAEATRE
ncbi:alpha/beta fold hydrolase [Halioglobus maricola]|nr:alpha/beta fold hydrolase [Halioglobus maricola]